MASILVTGGSGTVGRPLVALLRERSHDVRVLSRRAGRGTHMGDLVTGEGIREALEGVERVVHLAHDSPRGTTNLEQTRHLLAAAGDVRHLLYISIVGIDDIPLGYYKSKLACEQAIEVGDV